ncbi:hypothetical protein P171DRAFT_444674 [Karstenula rhodostoma CBS 690.94]|uniref:Uncharacterized protein n=1 Tax=Karstenula rhodostoma CBS 690.94 TaxID=1392251 RepID=A0A9P4PG88_9PLEO|nr:hypothetical protein P171DRAFT_444674 [Karstenula rhodostoma CBS 690.94]
MASRQKQHNPSSNKRARAFVSVEKSQRHLLYLNTVPLREKIDVLTTQDGEPDGSVSNKTRRPEEEISDDVSAAVTREVATIIDLYIFCEKIQDVRSKNILTTAILEATQTQREDGFEYTIPLDGPTIRLYDTTAPGNKMRKLLVDHIVVWGDVESLQELQHPSQWEKDPNAQRDARTEFMFDVAVALFKK